ncbi:hypothetical protein [Picosynechococcus sp. PCC 7117]|uniref:hypothetical protein n=1 Tax=Picosynechococcus sp. PCC 7117 TaxID=195498 RepID=UPI00081067DD|nr:hypothetical protein [Picosynechococcus sp. PCC 7117]ANV88487.1 hypothetical protein AWQ22_14025 [Picosynechococcus sp. PCC 7117]
MTPEEIQALVASQLDDKLSEFREEYTKANQGLAASLSKEVKKTLEKIEASSTSPQDNPEVEGEKLSLKSLEKQLEDMRKQLAEKDQETFKAKKNNAINQLIAESKALNPKALQKLFDLEYGGYIKEENGSWYVDKGEDDVVSLQDALDSYLNSEEGKFYLPPSNTQGSGSTEVKNMSPNPNQPVKAGEALMEAFSQY